MAQANRLTLPEFLALGATEEGQWAQALMVADYEDEATVQALEYKLAVDSAGQK